MSSIVLNSLSKSYSNKKGENRIYSDFSLTIDGNSTTAIIGPNGCGKTTLLNIISGIIGYEGGTSEVNINENHNFRIGIIPQNYNDALFPWLSCRDNILIPYTFKSTRKLYEEKQNTLRSIIGTFGWDNLPLGEYAYNLSGGQKQITCILRTFIQQPKLVLMDEPFSALDPNNKKIIFDYFTNVFTKYKPTIIIVSHELDDAILLSDRIIILKNPPINSINEVKVDLPHPRAFDMIVSNKFEQVRAECIKKMYF